MNKRRSRSLQRTLNVKGKLVESVTILGLAKIIGKSRDSIERYEKNDVFPQAPLMIGRVRYYPLSLARKLVPLVERLPRHKKPDAALIAEINKLFKEERDKLCL